MYGENDYRSYLQDDQNAIAHYGVLGMKWGIRHDPEKAYRRSMDKLSSLDSRAKSSNTGSAKYAKRAARATVKSVRRQNKVNKLEKKVLTGRADYSKLAKARKAQLRAAKRAARFQRKAASNQWNTVSYKKKAQKWANRISKEFSGVSLKNISAEDIAIGRSYVMTLFSNQILKHSDSNAGLNWSLDARQRMIDSTKAEIKRLEKKLREVNRKRSGFLTAEQRNDLNDQYYDLTNQISELKKVLKDAENQYAKQKENSNKQRLLTRKSK